MDTVRQTIRFSWIEDEAALRRHARELIGMIDASVADDGMLGYAAPLSPAEEDALLAAWAGQMAAGIGHMVLLADDAGTCGMCYMRTNANANYRHIADLSKGYLMPRARGSGAARTLFRALAARARELGVALLTLDTRQGSHAEAVWTHFGFRTWGVLDDYSRAFGRSFRGAYMSQTVESLETTLARTADEDHT